jgi:virulence-associated protein VagC
MSGTTEAVRISAHSQGWDIPAMLTFTGERILVGREGVSFMFTPRSPLREKNLFYFSLKYSEK